jgi:AcrR family transcriptional regulator
MADIVALATKECKMTQNNDPRVHRSQTLIRDAFMELIIEQGFEKMTVRAISERARINRATFYRHYTDKHDLAARLTDILFADVVSQFDEHLESNRVENWALLFEHVAQYATFYRAMMGKNGIPGFRDQVQESVEKEMMKRSAMIGVVEGQAKIPHALIIRYLAAAQVGFIQWWLENDMPFSPLEAAGYLLTLHTNGGMWALSPA